MAAGVHILRHSAAKLRREVGESVEDVSQFLDHSSLAVTTTYLRRLEGHEDRSWRQALDGYDELGSVEAVASVCWDMTYQLLWTAGFEEAIQTTQRGLGVLGERASAKKATDAVSISTRSTLRSPHTQFPPSTLRSVGCSPAVVGIPLRRYASNLRPG